MSELAPLMLGLVVGEALSWPACSSDCRSARKAINCAESTSSFGHVATDSHACANSTSRACSTLQAPRTVRISSQPSSTTVRSTASACSPLPMPKAGWPGPMSVTSKWSAYCHTPSTPPIGQGTSRHKSSAGSEAGRFVCPSLSLGPHSGGRSSEGSSAVSSPANSLLGGPGSRGQSLATCYQQRRRVIATERRHAMTEPLNSIGARHEGASHD